MYLLVITWIIGSQMHMAVLDHGLSYHDCHERLTRVSYIKDSDPLILTCEEQR